MNADKDDSRPNILFINTDQQSASMLSCAGNRYLHTPAMDRIGRQGMRFERAYCTNPVCLPSRFSFFTGRMPSELGIWDNHPRHLDRVPEWMLSQTGGHLLSNAGYRVAFGGKTHLPADMEPETMASEVISRDKREGLARATADWIREQGAKPQAPFFLSLCFVNPHDICFLSMREYTRTQMAYEEMNANQRWLLSDGSPEMDALNAAAALPDGMSEDAFYESVCPPLPANFEPQDNEPEIIQQAVRKEAFKQYIRDTWTENEWRLHRHAYCRMVERVDAEIGIVMDALDDAGLAENTLVIFTSDHGDQDASHQLDQKGYFYEESIRVPLLMRWPGRIPEGTVDKSTLVSNGLDLMPTWCDAAGVSTPDDLLGCSLLPIACGTSRISRESLPIECSLGRGVVRQHSKYICYHYGNDAEQFIDLINDPGEMRNAINEPSNSGELSIARDNFDAWFAAAAKRQVIEGPISEV